MPDERIAVVDVDDLWCEDQITRWLLPLKEAVPQLRVTCYCIPNKLGPVAALRERYPWVLFAIHGWEHSLFETRAWTDTLARVHMERAIEMGYAHLFKAPNWMGEPFLEEVCFDLHITLHHHKDYAPSRKGLLAFPGRRDRVDFEGVHTHIQRNPATDFIEGHEQFTPDYLARFDDFMTPIEAAVEIL